MTSSAPLDELDELARDLGELRLRREEVVLDAVHLERAAVDLALGVDVAMEAVLRRPAIDELDAADLDDPMARGRLEARGFGIEDDLTHQRRAVSMGDDNGARILPPPSPKINRSSTREHRRRSRLDSRARRRARSRDGPRGP